MAASREPSIVLNAGTCAPRPTKPQPTTPTPIVSMPLPPLGFLLSVRASTLAIVSRRHTPADRHTLPHPRPKCQPRTTHCTYVGVRSGEWRYRELTRPRQTYKCVTLGVCTDELPDVIADPLTHGGRAAEVLAQGTTLTTIAVSQWNVTAVLRRYPSVLLRCYAALLGGMGRCLPLSW